MHVYREADSCADFLAKKGAIGSPVLDVFHTFPEELASFLSAEELGTLFSIGL